MSVAIASFSSNHMGEPWRAAASQRVLPQYFPLPAGYSSAQRSRPLANPASTAAGYSQSTPRFINRSHSSRTVLHGWHQVAYMFSDVYDSDDALNRSPRLQPSVVNYGPDQTVPPFLQEKQRRASANGKRDSSSSPTSSEGRSPKRRQKRRLKPSLADVVLLNNLAPNNPELARQIGEGSPPVDTDSEDDSRTRAAHISSRPNDTQVVAAKDALNLMTEEPKPSLPSFQESFQGLVSQDPILAESPFPVRQTSPPRPLQRMGRPRQDSLAASNVGRYTIPPPNNLDFPALQAPTPSAAGSPENSQSLPSIGQALASLDGGATPTPFGAPTPTPQLSRGPSTLSTISTGPTPESSYAPSQMTTPYSHPSPMSLKDLSATSPLSQPQYAMQPPSLTHDTSNMTAYSEVSLRGAPVGRSPTHSYPTPTELRAAVEEHPDGIAGPNIYKCPYPGCTAGAFQTQYLLNSHANVHSQDRPHFCPVAGCPRGIGGKGFKRKNEMIRHGLVHDSPGYVCPFCIDQQHKYPRPDNLQRHVRVHHVDKDKDDPLLRDVLAQRPKAVYIAIGRNMTVLGQRMDSSLGLCSQGTPSLDTTIVPDHHMFDVA
ncbi:uncharacterized protein BHQ10_005435 [Talaromyces amestolkiae]|uniref:C2H2-type domain-containing protein n=1 Tax=Talaromyces amestolkiae TaxID=1196081 RepID=A0A364L0U1_TALAM|nr:uncharacterized protein BHQ10_005435 [Talaromyces amestolkiae]RAO69423.1 hypothetical protein BHQ10_005435 [Talaromyces amestolkiae]